MTQLSFRLQEGNHLHCESMRDYTRERCRGLFYNILRKTGNNYVKTKEILRNEYRLFIVIDTRPLEV